jgi:hypothetical protein
MKRPLNQVIDIVLSQGHDLNNTTDIGIKKSTIIIAINDFNIITSLYFFFLKVGIIRKIIYIIKEIFKLISP